MIRNLYEKVEHPMSSEKDSFGVNFKVKWRVRKAFEMLKDFYGGKGGLRKALIICVISLANNFFFPISLLTFYDKSKTKPVSFAEFVKN